MVAHEGAEDGIEPVFLLGRELCFHGTARVVGLLPGSEDGEYVGRTFQCWQLLSSRAIGADDPSGGCTEPQVLFR